MKKTNGLRDRSHRAAIEGLISYHVYFSRHHARLARAGVRRISKYGSWEGSDYAEGNHRGRSRVHMAAAKELRELGKQMGI